MAGFGYGANLSGVVSWASKTFWRRPWESRPRFFLLREEQWLSWRTDGCSRGCGWFTWNGTWSRLVVRSSCYQSVRAPLWECSNSASSLSLIECLCCVCHDCRGSDRISLTLLCKHGVRKQGILSQTRAILAHHSNEIHLKLLYLSHAIGWNDSRLCCRCSHRLIDNFGMWRLYRVYALSLTFAAR